MFTVERFVERTGVDKCGPASEKPRRHVFIRQDSNRVLATSFAATDRSSDGDTVSQRAPLYHNVPLRTVLIRNEETQRCIKSRGFEA